jgi:IclR family transcriptional regulator, acetate operon repressor
MAGAIRAVPDTAVSSQTIATVERAADVLTLFADAAEPTLGVTEIANELSLSKAAVHRILASLRTRGYVELDESSRRYSLGPSAFALGLSYLARIDVRSSAAPELSSLSNATDETATLSVLSGGGRIYIDQVTPPREIVMSVPLGQRFPLYAGSSSKVLLAFMREDEIETIISGPLTAITDTTLTEPTRLRRELAEIRKRGYATSAGERQAGAASVAAPIFDHSGRPVAAISVCGPAERMSENLPLAAGLVVEATTRVSSRLGHRIRADRNEGRG